jgi:Rhs element Vgr protein
MANAREKDRDQLVKTVVDYTIKVNGKLASPSVNLVSMIMEHEINRIPTLTLILDDGDAAREDFETSSLDLFAPGNELELQAGYLAEKPLVFKGVIVRHRIEIDQAAPHLELICKDPAFRMCLRRESRYFEDISDHELAEELMKTYGLTGEIETAGYRHAELVQYNVSDWDFLIMRMEMNGWLTNVENGRVRIQPPDLQQEPVKTLQYGKNVIAFEGELDVRNQFQETKTATWNYSAQEILESQAVDTAAKAGRDQQRMLKNQPFVNGDLPNTLRHGGRRSEDELQEWANARLLRERLSWAQGRVEFEGDPAVKPGMLIKLGGLGRRFEDPALVTGVRHEFSGGIWTTNAVFGLSPKSFADTVKVEAPPAAGLLAAVQGLQFGLVTQIENDPDGEFRIQVRLPIIDPQSPGIWARLATLDAGPERGSFFLPEIDDEVIVGFVNDDPRDAVVLGMLHSRNKAAPFSAKADNHEKGFVSREGMKVFFHEGEKSITLETPGGNRLVISDEKKGFVLSDQNGNSIEMNANGITLNSEKDIVLKAKKNVKNSAGAAWQAESKGKVSLKATGPNEIKGMPVNIN